MMAKTIGGADEDIQAGDRSGGRKSSRLDR